MERSDVPIAGLVLKSAEKTRPLVGHALLMKKNKISSP